MALESCDYLFTGGRLVDGSGDVPRYADVAVKGERILAVGSNLAASFNGGTSYDITGRVICPGFIDLHTHSDLTVLVNPRMESSVRQGVTTELVGNCGFSLGLINEDSKFDMERRWADRGGVALNWTDLSSFLQRIESSGTAINIGSLAGHGTIRKDVLGFAERKPDERELSLMIARLATAMDDGAFGLSTGLEYLPGGYAEPDEISAMADIVRQAGGFYASHIRDERDFLVDSVKEAIDVGKRSELPVQLSHHKVERKRNWGRVNETLGMMRDARSQGFDVSTDQYPYTAFMTGLSVILFPPWALSGGMTGIADRLRDPETRSKIISYIEQDDQDWEQIRVGVARNRRDAQGMTLAALGAREHRSPAESALELLIAEDGMVSAAYFAMSDDDVDTIIQDPFTMIGSDGVSASPTGPLGEDKTHPRTYGTFPRVLGEYVRRRGVLALEEAVRKMTSLPASRLKIHDRGYVEAGYFADLVVFDPDTVCDVATFDEPHQFPTGIDFVLVNGTVAVAGGMQTEKLAGKVLRRSRRT